MSLDELNLTQYAVISDRLLTVLPLMCLFVAEMLLSVLFVMGISLVPAQSKPTGNWL